MAAISVLQLISMRSLYTYKSQIYDRRSVVFFLYERVHIQIVLRATLFYHQELFFKRYAKQSANKADAIIKKVKQK